MFIRGICIAFLLILFLSARIKLFAEPATALSNDELVAFTGTIFMPDGSPAGGAVVEAIAQDTYPRNVVRADEAGLVQIRSVFGNGAKIHASSPDGALQATLMVMAADVRSAFAAPTKLNLKPAVPHVVKVFSEGQPVDSAEVVAQGSSFRVRGVTGPDGKVRIHLPVGESLRDLVAWHPKLGVAGMRDLNESPPQDTTQLSLLAPAPFTIRLVDTEGNSVVGIKLAAHFRTEESGWILSGAIGASHVQTDENGEAVLPWAPGEKLKYVDVTIIDSAWKDDKIDRDKIAAGLITVHIRRELPVTGRLAMPGGVGAEGILITGFGFGPYSNGDIPYARARQDGTFTMQVPSGHGYVLGISDSEWASDRWTGLILGTDSGKPADIEIDAYPATPLTVRVTRGPEHEPVEKAWVYVKSCGRVKFTDEFGEERTGSAGVGGWARTDSDGVARVAVGNGAVEVRLSSDDWNEKQSIEVQSDEPIEIAFHRAWQGDRQIVARMTLESAAYHPSTVLVAHAWSERTGYVDTIHETEIGDDGTIKVAFDAETLSLLVIDRENRLSGFTQLGPEDSAAEIAMQSTATYSGTVLDEQGDPLADRTMLLRTQSSFIDAVKPQQTDEAGRFQFSGVPVDTPLRLDVRNETDLPKYYVRSNDRLFGAGENRLNGVVTIRLADSPNGAKPHVAPLSERVANLCRNASVSRMRTLVILKGGGSAGVSNLTSRLLDSSEVASVRSYLPLVLSSEQREAESQAIEELGWPLPADGEIVLIVVGYDKETIATERIDTEDVDDSMVIGVQFLMQHMPPTRDAFDVFAGAKKEALSSGRRLWVVEGGPRCGPCFRLGRWIDEHHTTLEKDYVIIKLMSGIDDHTSEVIDLLHKKKGGCPLARNH